MLAARYFLSNAQPDLERGWNALSADTVASSL
jgi:hypothetical protein